MYDGNFLVVAGGESCHCRNSYERWSSSTINPVKGIVKKILKSDLKILAHPTSS